MGNKIDPTRGNWIHTYSGIVFYPFDPRPREILIEDIAHALAYQCRYAGHTNRFYSVAEHSVLVSKFVPVQDAFWGLMHDATEAYCSDIPRPIKNGFSSWKKMENVLMDAICEKFGMDPREPQTVKQIDGSICLDEVNVLMPFAVPDYMNSNETFRDMRTGDPVFLGARIKGWNPEKAKKKFLQRYRELTE